MLMVRAWGQVWGFSGGYYGDSGAQLLLRPFSRLELDVQPTVMLTDGEPRFLDADAERLALGQLRARSVGLTLRASYAFTPRLTLQTYAQPFVAANHYHDLSTFVTSRRGPGTTIPLAGLVKGGDGSDHDSKESTLNVSVVLRWEYALGSTLFVVYTRSQNPSVAAQPPGLDFHPLFRAHPAVDVFMAKMSYWWN
jgi:hypothetical protein